MPSGKSYLLSLPQLPWALCLLFHSDMASPSKTPFRSRPLKNSIPVALLSCHQQQKVLFLEAFFMHYHFYKSLHLRSCVSATSNCLTPKKENEGHLRILASCVLLKPWPLSIPCPTWRRSADSCTFCLRIKRPLSQRLLPIVSPQQENERILVCDLVWWGSFGYKPLKHHNLLISVPSYSKCTVIFVEKWTTNKTRPYPMILLLVSH